MISDSPNAVLRRKTSAAREVWQARAMSPAKALKLAFARAADDLMDLAMAVSSVEADTPGAEEMLGALAEGELLVLLDGPDGSIGVAALAFPVVAGLVEMLTMGRVMGGAPEPRQPTRTDAAMIAPLIDAAFANLEELLEGEAAAGQFAGYRFGVMLDNPRMVGLAIEATDFSRYRMRLDVAGARDGEVTLALPLREATPPAAEEGAEGEAPATMPLGPVLMAARARLDAVLHRVSLPLSEVRRLKPGDLLEVPRSALSDTVLEAGPRHRIAEVRLGQLNGFRAVRLTPADGAAAAGHAGTGPPPAEPPAPGAEAATPDAAEGGEPPGPEDMPGPGAPMEMGDLPSFDDLPQLDDLPELGDLPQLDDLPELGGEGDDLPDFGAAPMPGLPPLGD